MSRDLGAEWPDWTDTTVYAQDSVTLHAASGGSEQFPDRYLSKDQLSGIGTAFTAAQGSPSCLAQELAGLASGSGIPQALAGHLVDRLAGCVHPAAREVFLERCWFVLGAACRWGSIVDRAS